jgi:hypothetical protein
MVRFGPTAPVVIGGRYIRSSGGGLRATPQRVAYPTIVNTTAYQVRYHSVTRSAKNIAAWGPELPQDYKKHDAQENMSIDPATMVDLGGQLVGFGIRSATAVPQQHPSGDEEEASSVLTTETVTRTIDDTMNGAASLYNAVGGGAAVDGVEVGGDILEGVGGVCEAVVGIFGG